MRLMSWDIWATMQPAILKTGANNQCEYSIIIPKYNTHFLIHLLFFLHFE